MQVYHSNASTNINIRQQIQKNANCFIKDLAEKYNISTQNVSEWKHKASLTDASCVPLRIYYALSKTERSLIIALRKSTWLPLDEIHEMILNQNPNISRSSIYRCFTDTFLLKIRCQKTD